MKEVEEVLEARGFVMKQWVMSGDEGVLHEKLLDVSRERVLGLDWKPMEDVISFKVKLNFSKTARQGRAEPNILPCESEKRMPSLLTKRIILSHIAALYDPIALIIPCILKAKLLMRDVVMEGNGKQESWDEPVNETLYERAKSLFKEMFLSEGLDFRGV